MIPWGDDFFWSDAALSFKNMEDIIELWNNRYADIYLVQSTPSEYIDALKKFEDVEWPVRYDDMFPYADEEDAYWTGYFTSRPDAKKKAR